MALTQLFLKSFQSTSQQLLTFLAHLHVESLSMDKAWKLSWLKLQTTHVLSLNWRIYAAMLTYQSHYPPSPWAVLAPVATTPSQPWHRAIADDLDLGNLTKTDTTTAVIDLRELWGRSRSAVSFPWRCHQGILKKKKVWRFALYGHNFSKSAFHCQDTVFQSFKTCISWLTYLSQPQPSKPIPFRWHLPCPSCQWLSFTQIFTEVQQQTTEMAGSGQPRATWDGNKMHINGATWCSRLMNCRQTVVQQRCAKISESLWCFPCTLSLNQTKIESNAPLSHEIILFCIPPNTWRWYLLARAWILLLFFVGKTSQIFSVPDASGCCLPFNSSKPSKASRSNGSASRGRFSSLSTSMTGMQHLTSRKRIRRSKSSKMGYLA